LGENIAGWLVVGCAKLLMDNSVTVVTDV